MHKVILNDDDTIICRGISQTIDWQGNGFILCGVAKDAIQGLELVEEYRPDIVQSLIHIYAGYIRSSVASDGHIKFFFSTFPWNAHIFYFNIWVFLHKIVQQFS